MIILSKNCVIACVLGKKYLKIFVSFHIFVLYYLLRLSAKNVHHIRNKIKLTVEKLLNNKISFLL